MTTDDATARGPMISNEAIRALPEYALIMESLANGGHVQPSDDECDICKHEVYSFARAVARTALTEAKAQGVRG